MSQLARREKAPHRAAFVTSLSRWYIRRLLGNLPPFHPCLSAERRPRIVPYGTSPHYGHTPRKSRHSKPFLPSYQCIRNWSRSSEELCQTIGDIFSGGLVEAAPLLESSNRTQCSVSRGESGQHPKKQMRLEIIHGVLTTFQQPVGDVMYTGQEIMHGLTKTQYLTLPESSGRRKRHVPSTVLCGILSERDDMLFYAPFSLSGTGRGCRQPGTRLPGDIPARPRFTDEYTLRHRDAFQRGTWPASGRWNQDDLGNLCRR